MNIIVCLDDKNGMSFCGRRQSRDSVLCDRVLSISSGSKLWMNEYSAKLFDDEKICVDNNYLLKAQSGEYCFVEIEELSSYAKYIESIIVFRWNRHYPSDRKFDLQLLNDRSLKNSIEFKGSSHELITEELYVL